MNVSMRNRLAVGLWAVAAIWGVAFSAISAESPQRGAEPPPVFPAQPRAPEAAATLKGAAALPSLKSLLTIKEIGLGPERPVQGSPVESRVLLLNRGENDLPGVNVRLYLDRRLLGEQNVPVIKARGQATVRFVFTPDQPGRFTLKAAAAAADRGGENVLLEKPLEVAVPSALLSREKTASPAVSAQEGNARIKAPVGTEGRNLFKSGVPGLPGINTRADVVVPNLVGKVESIAAQGQGLVVTVRVVNQGTGVAPPFSLGIFLASAAGVPQGDPVVKARISEPLPPGGVKTIPLVFPPSPVYLASQLFVFRVDVDNEVAEGVSGEQDNTTPPFTLTPKAAVQIIDPLLIDSLKVLNPVLLPGETPKIHALILGGPVSEWQVSFKYSGGQNFIALYKKEPFPTLQSFGDYIEVPWPVWSAGSSAKSGEKAQIVLSVAGPGGLLSKKEAEVTLNQGAFFEGTVQLDQIAYQVSAGKITSVTLTLSYDAPHDFVLGDSGNPIFGGIGVTLEAINLEPLKTGPESYVPVTSVQKINFSVKAGNLDYPKGVNPGGKGTLKLVATPAVGIPSKGYLLHGIQKKEVIGVPPLITGFECCAYHYPRLRAGVGVFTETDVKSAAKEIVLENDSLLEEKVFYFYTDLVSTSGYVCGPCKK